MNEYLLSIEKFASIIGICGQTARTYCNSYNLTKFLKRTKDAGLTRLTIVINSQSIPAIQNYLLKKDLSKNNSNYCERFTEYIQKQRSC